MVPVSALLLLVITHLPPVPVHVAVAVFGALMMCNVGRMIAAMAMVTSSVEPRRRGAFLSVNSSVQHVASGIGAYLGGVIVTKAADGRIEHLRHGRLVGAAATLSTLWLASAYGLPINRRPRPKRSASPPRPKQVSMPASRCTATAICTAEAVWAAGLADQSCCSSCRPLELEQQQSPVAGVIEWCSSSRAREPEHYSIHKMRRGQKSLWKLALEVGNLLRY